MWQNHSLKDEFGFWNHRCVISRQVNNFCSDLMNAVCSPLNIERTRTSPNHPEGNGQAERHKKWSCDQQLPLIKHKKIRTLTFVQDNDPQVHRVLMHFALMFIDKVFYPIDFFSSNPRMQTLLCMSIFSCWTRSLEVWGGPNKSS